MFSETVQVFTGGTGRFANASGSIDVKGCNSLDSTGLFVVTFTASGTLSYLAHLGNALVGGRLRSAPEARPSRPPISADLHATVPQAKPARMCTRALHSVRFGSRPLRASRNGLTVRFEAHSRLGATFVRPGQDPARRTRRLSFEVERPRLGVTDVRRDARNDRATLHRFSPKHGDREGSRYGRHRVSSQFF